MPRQQSKAELHSLDEIVAHFRRTYQRKHNDELNFYALQNHAVLIKFAAESLKPNGKRDSHQSRLKQDALEEAKLRLLQANIAGCKTFDELLALVEETIGPIHGIGVLTIYDIAVRIGAKYGLEPDKVYLHAGARAGAKALGLDRHQAYLMPSELPTPLQALKPREVEDLLCIYKAQLEKI